MANDLTTLRAFRDQFLLQTSIGTAFVEAYYTWGRFGAAYIADEPILRTAARILLTPFVWAASAFVAFGSLGAMILFLSLGMIVVASRRVIHARILRNVPMEVRS